MPSLEQFRKRVVRQSLFAPRSLGQAIERLGFVQADPIRCPARAQDLILRHRVKGYKAGDLEQAYPALALEECFLYAYGFSPRSLWRILHPKPGKALSTPEKDVLSILKKHGPLLPKGLEEHVGGTRVRNYWGGFSRSAKMAMESLHGRGLLRVSHREKGMRVYESADAAKQTLSGDVRYAEVVATTLKALGPLTSQMLLRETGYSGYLMSGRGARQECIQAMIDAGRVRVDRVDEVEYLSLAGITSGRPAMNRVRILAPFDPVVRDRKRFEHLWGWTYRFEAYTPKAKRKLGYYAMPVLWRDWVVGWANANVMEGRLHVDFGYVNGRPDDPGYRDAAEREVVRLATFLGVGKNAWEAGI